MKTIKFFALFFAVALSSCSSVNVNADYDKNTSFEGYKTYAYNKTSIDKVSISDLDKKRILRSIDESMNAKGLSKSENPDVLVNFFTKERDEVRVNQYGVGWNYGWSYGWNPWIWGGQNISVSQYSYGTLTIDLIDARKNELIWQGTGDGALTNKTEDKDENIREFVTKILEQYPPKKK